MEKLDAEHPTFIPMYTPTTPQALRIHKMRPRLCAIGHKVNSLLSEPSLSTCETWLLPQICVLCMTRNKEEDHGRASEDTKYKNQEEETPKKLQPPDDRWRPDVRHLMTSLAKTQQTRATTSGRSVQTGRPVTSQRADDRPHRTSDTCQQNGN